MRMSTEQLLNECLVILRSIKDDRKSLEKLLGFMKEEFVENNEINLFEIPDYKLLMFRTSLKPLTKK